MNIIQTAKKILGLGKKGSASGINLTDAKGFIQTYRDFFSLFRNNENYFGVIAACIEVWGKHLAKAEFNLFDAEEAGIEIQSHPVLTLITKPNPFMTAWEMKYRIAQDFALYGNSYMLKIRNRLNTPVMLVQMHPDRVFTYPYDMEYIEHYEYQPEYLRVFMGQLRKKLEPDPSNPRYLVTEPWVGYRFNPNG